MKFEKSGSGSQLAYLDLDLTVVDGKMTWELYEKPQSKFNYLAWESAHCHSVHRSVVTGGVVRIWRRCHRESDVLRHVGRFVARLHVRGYPHDEVQRLVDRTISELKTARQSRRVSSVRGFSFGLEFKRGLPVGIINRRLKILTRRLAVAGVDAPVQLCWRSGTNLFRKYWARNWGRCAFDQCLG